jgi:hypothetical protein
VVLFVEERRLEVSWVKEHKETKQQRPQWN